MHSRAHRELTFHDLLAELRRAVPATGNFTPIPELVDCDLAALRASALGQIALARTDLLDEPMPETSYSRYYAFFEKSDRKPYQDTSSRKRHLMACAVMLAWLDDKNEKALHRACDLIWSICEETTWVVPAHSWAGFPIDLTSSSTAAELALAAHLLRGRLPQPVVFRIHREVSRRIFEPYLEWAGTTKFEAVIDNWTGVCGGSIGEAAFLLEIDHETRLHLITHMTHLMRRYFDEGFEPDGGCLEGTGYWQYGLAYAISFCEMLRATTNGAFDLLTHPKLRKIAQFPIAMAVAKNEVANFADCANTFRVQPYIATRLAERTGVRGLLAMSGPAEGGGGLRIELHNLLWAPTPVEEPLELQSLTLPDSGIAKRAIEWRDGHPVVLVAKAGHNDEMHNHNDVGSFILAVGGHTYLCDPGPGLYDKNYCLNEFRYTNVFTGGHGHNVPRFGGIAQPYGKQYKGTIVGGDDESLRIEFHEAYELPQLTKLMRTIRLTGAGLILQDEVVFDGDPFPVEETFMTWFDVSCSGDTASIQGPAGVLDITADGGVCEVERLEEECKANDKTAVLSRITVTFPACPSQTARVNVRLR